MSCGLTTKITVSASAAASALSIMVIPYLATISTCRSGRRSVATIGRRPAGAQQPGQHGLAHDTCAEHGEPAIVR